MTHDIDYPIHGPGKSHILQRRERFSAETIRRVETEGYNPYYGIPEIISLEERWGVRSTFFFRPYYDDGSPVDQYKQVMRELARGGWEIGVHVNNAELMSTVMKEKAAVEYTANIRLKGSRVHYLKIRHPDLAILEHSGLEYDSSVCFNKSHLEDRRNYGYFKMGNLVEFPITIMDAYMFTYMNVQEDAILKAVDRALTMAEGFMTILWHDSCLKMKRGRAYKDVLAYLAARPDVEIMRGIDALELLRKEIATCNGFL
ncbi:MAG: hypothetical protein MN733_03840 [Nitrososphaera sp.]|nr:hypothetical protein [Nitrososphaera sp.]